MRSCPDTDIDPFIFTHARANCFENVAFMIITSISGMQKNNSPLCFCNNPVTLKLFLTTLPFLMRLRGPPLLELLIFQWRHLLSFS